MGKRVQEHSFSIEMKSERPIKKILFLDEDDHIFFEGYLGELKNVSMVEGVMLEIEGKNGILKLDIMQHDIEKCLVMKKTSKNCGGIQ